MLFGTWRTVPQEEELRSGSVILAEPDAKLGPDKPAVQKEQKKSRQVNKLFLLFLIRIRGNVV